MTSRKKCSSDGADLEHLEDVLRKLDFEHSTQVHGKEGNSGRESLWSKVQEKRALHERMANALRALPGRDTLAFAELLKSLRDAAALDATRLAGACGMGAREYLRLEEGHLDPLTIPPERMARLIEAFSIPLSLLEASLNVIAERPVARRGPSVPMARSSGPADVRAKGAAMADMEAVLAQKRREKSISRVQAFVAEVRDTLQKWGLERLL